MLPWAFMYKVFVRTYVSFLLEYIPKSGIVEFLGHMITLCLTFWGSTRPFSKVTAPFYSPQKQCIRVSISSHLYQHLLKKKREREMGVSPYCPGWLDPILNNNPQPRQNCREFLGVMSKVCFFSPFHYFQMVYNFRIPWLFHQCESRAYSS